MNESTDSFYSRHGLHVEIYDAMTSSEWGLRSEDIGFYLSETRAANGPILELGCGTGRVTFPLLDAGLPVHGLDASAAMLQVAESKRSSLPEDAANRLQLHLGDMVEFEMEERFALVLIPFRAFHILLTPERQRACLLCIRKHLAVGGRLMINLFDPRYEWLLPGKQASVVPPREFVHPTSGNRVLVETLERVNDPMTQSFRERWRFTESDAAGAIVRQEVEALQLRWTFRDEMRLLAELCGFVVEAEYSDFHRSAPAYGKEQVWVFKVA